MPEILPSTPAEVLDLSTRTLRLKVAAAVKAAELFGHWRHPYAAAATSFEEMTLRDIYYWVYKSRNPILRMEKGRRAEEVFSTDRRGVGLPDGFEPKAALTLAAAGDILQSDGLAHAKDRLFENVSDLLFDRTIAFANFESPVTNQALRKEVIGDREAPTECCSAEQFAVLAGHRGKRFDVLNTANNHILDMGLEGIETTLRIMSDHGILAVGTIADRQDFGQGTILVRNGIRIGFAAVTFGLNGHAPPPGEEHRVYTAKLLSKFSGPDLGLLERQIDHCKAQGCDFTVASLHWGYEFEFFPRMRQVAIARELVEHGADAILSHHPHVIQPVEYYRTRRDPDRIAVIAYSLGSLVWGFRAPHLALSAILDLGLAKGRVRGKDATYVETARVTPVFQSSVVADERLLTTIEKLSDHLGRPDGPHPERYVAQMKAYADLVLGDHEAARPV